MRAISHLWAVIGVAPSLRTRDMGRAWGRAGPVRSSSANYTAKIPDGPESVYSFDTPCSAPLKSWLVVARGASAHSNWLGTSAGSIGTRPAASGSPASAWAAGASGERRAEMRCFAVRKSQGARGG